MKNHRFRVTGPSGIEFDVQFRVNTRAKRLILRLDPKSGEAVVTAPAKRDFLAAQRFVRERSDWLEAQKRKTPAVAEIRPGAQILFRGQMHTLSQSPGKGKTQRIDADMPMIDSPGADLTFESRIIRFLRLEAKQALQQAVDRHATRLAASPKRISIRDTRSRWGSCSMSGNLSFSWRLILAPDEVLDYVAAHEVAHLIEHNHSKAFWDLVEKTYGPYKQARNWLKANGAQLHAVGSSGFSGG